jgi:hypothetical protein
MSAASEPGTSKRGTTRSRASSSASSDSRPASAATRGRQASTPRKKSTASSARQTRTQSQSGDQARERPQPQGRSQSPSRSQSQTENGARGAISNIVIPVATATIGVAGGVLLGRRARQRHRKVLGVPVPIKIDLGGLAQHIGQAGRQLETLARGAQIVRETAEQIGRAVD